MNIKFFYPTAMRISLAVGFFLLISCIRNNNEKYIYRSVKLLSDIQLVKTDNNQLFEMKDSINIFYHNNYIIYQLPYLSRKTKIKEDKSGNILSETILKEEIKYSYIIYDNAKQYSYMFDSLNTRKPFALKIDSFLMQRTFKGFPFYSEKNDILLESIKSNINHNVIEKHIYKDKKDRSYFDSIYYYFGHELKNIDYSFSRKLDSSRNLKLYKVKMIYNKSHLAGSKPDIPRREFVFEIKKNTNYNKEDIISLENRFISIEKTLSK